MTAIEKLVAAMLEIQMLAKECERTFNSKGEARAISQIAGAILDEYRATQTTAEVPTMEDVAAYLLDRADQYETKDWRWNPLADAAHSIMQGELREALAHGELQEPELRRRVRNWARSTRRCASE